MLLCAAAHLDRYVIISWLQLQCDCLMPVRAPATACIKPKMSTLHITLHARKSKASTFLVAFKKVKAVPCALFVFTLSFPDCMTQYGSILTASIETTINMHCGQPTAAQSLHTACSAGFALSAVDVLRVARGCTSKVPHPLHIRELNGANNLNVYDITHLAC